MEEKHTYTHTSPKCTYTITVQHTSAEIKLHVEESLSIQTWNGTFGATFIQQQLTKKTGLPLSYPDFVAVLVKALEKKDQVKCFIDVLSSQDLQNLRNKKGSTRPQSGHPNINSQKPASKSNKRYVIVTYMSNDSRVHYPLPLAVDSSQSSNIQKLRELYKKVRQQIDQEKLKALNETTKTEQSANSFSINYQKRTSNNKADLNSQGVRQIDQLKSENEILKSKLKRLHEQAIKKTGSTELETIEQRKNELQEMLEKPNTKLVDIRYDVQEQQELYVNMKQQLIRLHKQISQLLVTEKEVKLRKHGEEVEKQLEKVRGVVNKNQTQIQRLKAELEKAKIKNKDLEIKAKKLNTQKDVVKKGKRGPYSSYSGSIRGGSSKASSINGSVSSKRSGYSYNSYKYR